MKATKYLLGILLICACTAMLSSFFRGPSLAKKHFKLPYKIGGLTERQAAAHLLNRFTYGATPGQIDAVVKMGLEKWFESQLDANLPDDSLNKRLASYDALGFNNEAALNIFPDRGTLYNWAARDGYVKKDSLYVAVDKRAFNAEIATYMADKGYRPEQELLNQFISQKIIRAAYTNNQLQEVLTDFWFNHFNVSYSKNGPGRYIPAYERDVIRPNVLGRFDSLLLATAKSPAMLLYLDNNSSVAPPDPNKKPVANLTPPPDMMMGMGMTDTAKKVVLLKPPVRRNVPGLNENYAREVMELHTLGVDGGYTQSDVTQAARVLTGWTMFPIGENNYNNGIKKQYVKQGEGYMASLGYYHEKDFLFNPTRHDKGEKTVLGRHFGTNGGYYEGVDLLEMLAHHPSTAKFITRKIAVRFVSDAPPQSLLDKMNKSFTDHDGDIRQVLITMVTAPEFWGKDALREKTKSPFELAMSSIRSLNADIQQPMPLYNWIARMGEKLYYYLAPTGFPDKGAYWINTGSLLNRMNFGLALTSGRIPGLAFNLAALNDHHEPEGPEAALVIYSKLLMPERNLDETIKRLSPMLAQPDLAATVNASATAVQQQQQVITVNTVPAMADGGMMQQSVQPKQPDKLYASAGLRQAPTVKQVNNPMLSQVVGIIIGSPEYQRR